MSTKCSIILIVDNFSTFVGLYPEKTTSTLEFVKVIYWVGIFGVPKVLRSDRGSQFTSDIAEIRKYLLKYEQLVVVPYHRQGNSYFTASDAGGRSLSLSFSV